MTLLFGNVNPLHYLCNMKILIYDIDFSYDYDEEMDITETDYEVLYSNTSSQMVVDDSDLEHWDNEEELEELLSQYISDETGFLHQGFSWKVLVD